jgi:hypothetical protein
MQQNLISATLSDATVAEVAQHIQKINDLLGGLLVNLEVDDRRGMAKLGDKTLAFVGKTFEYGSQNSLLVPAFVDLAEGKKDLALATQLNTLAKLLMPLSQSVIDTATVAGSDAYVAGLGIYGHIKAAAANNVPGATNISDDLAKRFPGKSRNKKATDAGKGNEAQPGGQ